MIDKDNKKVIDEAKEIDLYFIINELGGIMWRLNHDMADGRIEENKWAKLDEEIAVMRETQKYAVSKLTKFGVKITDDGKPTAEYWAWFRWWDNWKKNMPEAKWKELNDKMMTKADISKDRPEGDWHDEIEKERKNAEEWKRMNEAETVKS